MNSQPHQRTKVLIQTVGTGGPEHPVWEALASVCREEQPDVLVQVCSQLTHKETIPRFDALWQRSPTTKVERSIVDDPDNVETLLLELNNIAKKLRHKYRDAELLVDFTSGTKPMSAAAVAAAIGQQANAMLYAIGNRDESGRVTQTTDVKRVSTDQVYAERLLDELGRLFNQRQFRAVCDQTWPLVCRLNNDNLRAKASSLWYLADVYQQWNLFQYREARVRLKCRENLTKCGNFTPDKRASRLLPDALAKAGWETELIDRQFQFVKCCEDQHDTTHRLVDLWANAERCCHDGRFDDAVARLYRLIEYLCQIRFCRIANKELSQNNPTSKVPLGELRKLAPAFVEQYLGNNGRDQVNLGLNDVVQVLAEAGDKVGIELRAECQMESKKTKGKLGELLYKRNDSLLGHGKQPIVQQTAEGLLQLSQKYLRLHVECENQDFDALLQMASFARCPWADEVVA